MPKKYYLVFEKTEPLRIYRWYVLERGVDFKMIKKKSSSKDGYITTIRTVLYEADTLPDMLHQIQDNQDWRFYVELGSYSSIGEQRNEKYPNHRSLTTISGFIREVCDIREREGKPFFDAKWELDYISSLWICPGGYSGNEMYRVEGFTEKMMRSVNEYISEHGLEMGYADGA